MRSEISASFGNRPRLFLEKRIFPAYSTSNRPALEHTTSAGTPNLFVSSSARLAARDLCLQVEQYVILNLSSISLTPYVNKGLEWPSPPVERSQGSAFRVGGACIRMDKDSQGQCYASVKGMRRGGIRLECVCRTYLGGRSFLCVASRNYGTPITKKACPAVLDNVGYYLFLCPGQRRQMG